MYCRQKNDVALDSGRSNTSVTYGDDEFVCSIIRAVGTSNSIVVRNTYTPIGGAR